MQKGSECCEDFKLNCETCFQTGVKRKILAIESMTNALITPDPDIRIQLKTINLKEYLSTEKKSETI